MTWLDWTLIVMLIVTNIVWFSLLRLASKQLKFLSKLILLERDSKTPITTLKD
jgi:hypothetical protein